MSETEIPEPLTPADCDLRSLPWFPLHHKDLADSSWWNSASDVARSRSMDLWIKAYQQVPAASLPDHDVTLAKWAGFGRDFEAWAKHRDEILRPWVLCSDGRYYHPRLAEVAVEAWALGEANRRRWREKKRKQRGIDLVPTGEPATSTGDKDDGPPNVPGAKPLTRHNKTIQKDSETPPVDSVGAPADPKPAKTPAKPKATKASRKERSTPIVWDWTLDETDAAYAVSKGYTPEAAAIEGEKFFAYYRAKGTLWVDWRAVWRKWILNNNVNGGPQGGNRISASNRQPSHDRGVAQRQDRVGAMLEGAMGALDDLRR